MTDTLFFEPQPWNLPLPTATPPPRRLYKDMFHAQISPQDPLSGLRGWELYVCIPGRVADWPRFMWSRQGVRPPTPEQRAKALSELGYEPVDESAEWEWQEGFDTGGRVKLFASLDVKPVE